MPRPVIGVTWTAEERAMMKLPPCGTTTPPASRVSSHETSVSLSDGTTCPVTYRRFGACSHRFLFGEPLQEVVWFPETLHNTASTIEAKAQELAAKAFAQAMAEEQRLMRCKTVPRGSAILRGEPQMKAKAADPLAGLYAVCMRFSDGRLSAIGAACSTALDSIAALNDGTFKHVQLFGEQRLVIGICCRYLRRWVEPRLLPFQRHAPAVSDNEDVVIE